MHGPALLLTMALPLALVFVLPLTRVKYRARLARDPVEAVMFGVAGALAFALLVCAATVTRTHNIAIVKDVILAAGVFAVVGIGVGLFRSLRRKPA